MKVFRNLFPYLFGLITIAQLYSTFHPLTLDWLNYLSKPLIMLSLLLYFVATAEKGRVFFPTILAILFSFSGDVLLLFQEEADLFFILGLASFLVAQASYFIAFNRAPVVQEIPIIRKYPLLMGAYGAYGFWIFMKLRPDLGPLELPVLFYMMAILAMGISALNRFGKVSRSSFLLVFLGSLFFIASDSILAFNKFSAEMEWGGFWIMLTYIGAQLFIVRGLARS